MIPVSTPAAPESPRELAERHRLQFVDLRDVRLEREVTGAIPLHVLARAHAVDEGASDVHFIPQADGLVARIRVDGVLEEVERIPLRHARGVVTRIKVLAKLDIAEHRLPQDGRLSLRSPKTGRLLDMRVAVLPTVDGEGVIMRLHDKTRRAPP